MPRTYLLARRRSRRAGGDLLGASQHNPGGSITNSAEVIAAAVKRANELPTPLVWVEHWSKASTGEGRRRSS